MPVKRRSSCNRIGSAALPSVSWVAALDHGKGASRFHAEVRWLLWVGSYIGYRGLCGVMRMLRLACIDNVKD